MYHLPDEVYILEKKSKNFSGNSITDSPAVIFLMCLTPFLLMTALSEKCYYYHSFRVEETMVQPAALARTAPGRKP